MGDVPGITGMNLGNTMASTVNPGSAMGMMSPQNMMSKSGIAGNGKVLN